MQASMLYRRGVVLPLDDDAERALSENDVDSTTNVMFVKIPTEGLFTMLWHLRIFEQINERCGLMIDDYEEEWVPAQAAKDVLAIANSISSSTPEIKQFLEQLRVAATTADETSRPLLFVL